MLRNPLKSSSFFSSSSTDTQAGGKGALVPISDLCASMSGHSGWQGKMAATLEAATRLIATLEQEADQRVLVSKECRAGLEAEVSDLIELLGLLPAEQAGVPLEPGIRCASLDMHQSCVP